METVEKTLGKSLPRLRFQPTASPLQVQSLIAKVSSSVVRMMWWMVVSVLQNFAYPSSYRKVWINERKTRPCIYSAVAWSSYREQYNEPIYKISYSYSVVPWIAPWRILQY